MMIDMLHFTIDEAGPVIDKSLDLEKKLLICFDNCQHQLAILPRSEANRETAALLKIGKVAFGGRIFVVQYDAGTKVNMRNKCWLDIKRKRISKWTDISVFTLTLTLSG